MSSVPERSDIDAQYKWDLESIYATDEEWEEAYEDVEERLGELEKYEGQVTDDGETLLTVLQLSDELGREVSMVASYARMRSDEDTSDQEYQALATRAQSLASRAGSATSFIEPEIQSLDRDELDRMIDETDGLETYEHALDDVIRMKAHTRSAEIENLLAEFGEVTGAPNDIYSMLSNADMTFPTVEDPDGESVEISQSNFVNLLKNPDREFRQTVYEGYFDEWSDVRNAVGAA